MAKSTSLMIVTILILIDGFLQSTVAAGTTSTMNSHNPYFNRWFSAIKSMVLESIFLVVSQSLF